MKIITGLQVYFHTVNSTELLYKLNFIKYLMSQVNMNLHNYNSYDELYHMIKTIVLCI